MGTYIDLTNYQRIYLEKCYSYISRTSNMYPIRVDGVSFSKTTVLVRLNGIIYNKTYHSSQRSFLNSLKDFYIKERYISQNYD